MNRFYPDIKFDSIKDITPEFLKEKSIKYALLDIDNTLVSYTIQRADENAKAFLKMLTDCGIKYAFVSNNHKPRVELFAKDFDAEFVHDAGKPLLFGIKRAMRKIGAEKSKTVFIGDQVFTDVYAGKRAGLFTIMVNPIEAKETPFFAVKRYFEKIVLKDFE